MRGRLLDLCCGVGGMAQGFADAGFEVVGVDIAPQPNFPFEFHQLDAMQVAYGLMVDVSVIPGYEVDDFDAVHASFPCPRYSSMNGWSGESDAPDLVPEGRRMLQGSGLPYVIENVPGAPLENPVQLCGSMFGLEVEIGGELCQLRRHRLFETNFPVMTPSCWHRDPAVTVVGGSIGRKVFDPKRKSRAPSLEQAKAVMGIPWAETAREVANAIPPAYAEFIGGYLKAEVERRLEDGPLGEGHRIINDHFALEALTRRDVA